jgi:hypothetical protein
MNTYQPDADYGGGYVYQGGVPVDTGYNGAEYQEYYPTGDELQPTMAADDADGQDWALSAKIYPIENASVSSIEYDPVQELLWAGFSNGRVQSYLAGTEYFENRDVEPSRYSSFRVSDSPIVNVWPLESSVISLSRTNCRLHTKGGMLVSDIADTTISETDIQFTCSSIFRRIPSTLSSYELANQQFWQSPSHLFVGTNSAQAFCFDLNRSSGVNTPKIVLKTEVASTCVVENGAFSIFGCKDGKLRLFDSRMRSDKAQQSLSAQTASILDMTVNIGGYLLASCGMEARAINPYDPNSPTKLRPDPTVHLTDLRMMKSLASVPAKLGSIPISVRFGCQYSSCIPGKSGIVSDDNLLILSNKGVISTIDTRLIGSPAEEVLFAIDEEDFSQNASVALLSVSGSGDLLATATSIGSISQFCRPFDPDLEEKKCINERSKPLEIPNPFPVPDFSFKIDYPCLGTSYVLSGAVPPQSLSSSFWTTPAGILFQI